MRRAPRGASGMEVVGYGVLLYATVMPLCALLEIVGAFVGDLGRGPATQLDNWASGGVSESSMSKLDRCCSKLGEAEALGCLSTRAEELLSKLAESRHVEDMLNHAGPCTPTTAWTGA